MNKIHFFLLSMYIVFAMVNKQNIILFTETKTIYNITKYNNNNVVE